VNYAYTIRDKMGEHIKGMMQIENNSAEQALLGDFSKAIYVAILDSSEALHSCGFQGFLRDD